MSFSEKIFRAYDIRGLIKDELSIEFAYLLGASFVNFLKKKNIDLNGKKIVIGRDMRESGLKYKEKLIAGIIDQGIDVVDIGLATTPLFNFACVNYAEHVAGIMITASHNPAEYNGFKLTMGDGLPIAGDNGLMEIKEMCKNFNFEKTENIGQVFEKNVFIDYKSKLFSLVDVQNFKKMKIVIDAGNGMAKATFPEILKDFNIDVEYLFLEPDGNFPNHEANPLKTETLKSLQEKVLAVKADFGFALDGDADRVGLVDEKGQIIPASFVGAIIGLEVLRKQKGLMLYDLRTSRAVKEIWEKAGAKTDICPVGHSNIKKMMKENNAIFASELSLHLYYRDLHDVESGDLSLLYIIDLLSRENKKMSEIWEKMGKEKYHSGEINFEVENKEEVMEKIKNKYSDGELNELDGILINYKDFWFSVRCSNTESVIRLNLEANSEELMREKVEEISEIIKKI
ncbi:MAG: phosphomannomutase/phosphoglucomutase [Patescibacteria group bacterium]